MFYKFNFKQGVIEYLVNKGMKAINDKTKKKIFGSYEGNEVSSYFHIAFFLFLTPAGGTNPSGLIFKPCGALINPYLT